MKLKGIEFGQVFAASGLGNFLGQGYSFHKFFRLLPGFSFAGLTFVSKTTTLNHREGNMPLRFLMPKELSPACIWVDFSKGIVLNSVGLSGPGAKVLFRQGAWQAMQEPFLISFMAVSDTREGRVEEVRKFIRLLLDEMILPTGKRGFGVELNISCPNTLLDPKALESDALSQLEVFSHEIPDLPVVLKVNALMDTGVLAKISKWKACDAITISNTIPWGQLPEKINWARLFDLPEEVGIEALPVPVEMSPLYKRNSHFGGGGLSGWPLIDVMIEKIGEMRSKIDLPIIAGGGIGCRRGWKNDLEDLKRAGANAVSIGSVAILRPWRMINVIETAHRLFGRRSQE